MRPSAHLAAFVAVGFIAAQVARAATLTTLATFTGTANGANPYAGLTADGSGNLYGTTFQGGASNLGTLFKITPGGTFSTLKTFTGVANGSVPQSKLALDASGNVYGTTNGGGPNDAGTVFKLTSGGTFSTLATFNNANGYIPAGGLTVDAGGNLYGTTYGGGANSVGTVYKLTSGGTLSTLAAFNNANGANPFAGPIRDAGGNLYGTTYNGGAMGYGSVYKLATDGTLSTLASFDNTFSGANPSGGLTADASGNLYGTTPNGGVNGVGTVFKLAADGTLSTLVTFNTANGGTPLYAGLIADANGSLYGTTFNGGAIGGGTVFKLATDGTLTTLFSFNTANGAGPRGSLLADASGNLYGTTSVGGASGKGTVYKLAGTGFVVPEPTALATLATVVGSIARRRRRV